MLFRINCQKKRKQPNEPLKLVNVFIGQLTTIHYYDRATEITVIFIYFAVKTTAERRQTAPNGSDDKAECLLFIPQGIISTAAGDNNI